MIDIVVLKKNERFGMINTMRGVLRDEKDICKFHACMRDGNMGWRFYSDFRSFR